MAAMCIAQSSDYGKYETVRSRPASCSLWREGGMSMMPRGSRVFRGSKKGAPVEKWFAVGRNEQTDRNSPPPPSQLFSAPSISPTAGGSN